MAKSVSDFNYYHLSLLNINPAETNDASLADYYKLSVDEYRENMAKVFEVLTTAKGTVLFHCFFGKDRTGIVAAILLKLAGVSMEDIIADYHVSYAYIKPFFEKEIASGSGLIWETNLEHLRSDEATIIELMSYIEDKFGSVEDYLEICGLSRETISKAAGILK